MAHSHGIYIKLAQNRFCHWLFLCLLALDAECHLQKVNTFLLIWPRPLYYPVHSFSCGHGPCTEHLCLSKMPPKITQLERMEKLAEFVQQPNKLSDLRKRSGTNLKEKLRQKDASETAWYLFLHRSMLLQPALARLAQLDALVTEKEDVSVSSPSTDPMAGSLAPQMLRAPSAAPRILAKSIKRPWCNDVADGNKFFECNANRRCFRNEFGKLNANDLFIIVEEASKCKVVAVGRVRGPAESKVQDRAVLYSMLLPHRREALDAYLGAAPSFNYVMFDKVYDTRNCNIHIQDVMQTAQLPAKKDLAS